MSVAQPIRHSEVLIWMMACVAAILLALFALTNVAGSSPPEDPEIVPTTEYIVSPATGLFVAGEYQGADPYVTMGSKIEPGDTIGNIEVWRRLEPIYSTVRGTVTEVHVFDQSFVSTGSVLFKVQIEPDPPPA